ncbi:MAG: hypothetical protein AAF846_27385 [Chloroflexota bacterium]
MRDNIRYAIVGFIVWVIVLAIVRFLGTTVFSAGNPLLILFYIVTFPLGIAFVTAFRALFKLPMSEMMHPMVIFAIVALMMDGFSFGFTKFYGVGEHELYAAAYLLWAPGVFLLCAWWLVSRAKQSTATT